MQQKKSTVGPDGWGRTSEKETTCLL
jgi:hypothetical protein